MPNGSALAAIVAEEPKGRRGHVPEWKLVLRANELIDAIILRDIRFVLDGLIAGALVGIILAVVFGNMAKRNILPTFLVWPSVALILAIGIAAGIFVGKRARRRCRQLDAENVEELRELSLVSFCHCAQLIRERKQEYDFLRRLLRGIPPC